MLKAILVGLDGSPHSASAIELGIQWAKRHDALLVGLGIVDEPTIRQAEAVPLGAAQFKRERDDALLAEARRHVEQYLQQFALRCATAQVASKPLEDVGLPFERIVLEAQRFDLILLGQQTRFHGETQAGRDDTLTKVLKNSPRPVVAVPHGPPRAGPVLVAYDGSLQAARTLLAFAATNLHAASEVHVLCADPDGVEAARRADRAVEYLSFRNISARRLVAPTGDAADAVLGMARELGAGLLVAGAYGQSTLREFFFGSVTRRLLRESPVPLFLFH
jgi:nucleotide-binding universal stress UspA family protein